MKLQGLHFCPRVLSRLVGWQLWEVDSTPFMSRWSGCLHTRNLWEEK